MDPALRTSATGMIAQQLRVEVIAHNLANVNTPAFKRSRAHFEDLLYQTVQGGGTVGQPGAESLPAIQIGRGTRLSAVQRVDGQGPLEPTGRPLDVAIDGAGFFQVRRPDGTVAYTRDGSFTLSDQGILVTSGGYALLPEIRIPPEAKEIMISRNGVVSVLTPESPQPLELGRIELARFINPPGLVALGENLYGETAASGPPILGLPQEDGFGSLLQGNLEASNVEIVQEMVDMIAALRAYELNAKAVQVSERMSELTNGMIR
ncbi:MAG TPA: flagellar basal-body rod protein FlgG [Longimicrobiales bacterium]|jgi:flagellar basal-body rod protein FlgG